MSDQLQVRLRDVAVAAGCWLVTITSLIAVPVFETADPIDAPGPGDAGWWLGVAALTVQAALLVWARVAPRQVLVGVAAVAPVAAVPLGEATGLTSLAVLIATYVAATTRRHGIWPVALAAGALVAVAGVVSGVSLDAPAGEVVLGSVVQAVGTIGLPLLVATVVVARREAREALESRALAVEREQESLIETAIARERTAMARELHDIAAHHLTGIAVMTAAIGTQIDSDPVAAKQALGDVRRQSTAVLRDLRSLVGLLRDQDPEATPEKPRPETLTGIAALVADSPAGLDIDLTVLSADDGRPLGRGVGPLAQLAGYRMVQESLANAARHAPGARCAVTVDDRAADAVVLVVSNGPPAVRPAERGPAGFGLVGMRERAELTRARLEVGPTADGGWLVSMSLPREADS